MSNAGRLERLSKKMMRLLEVDGEEALHYTNVSAKQLFEDAKKSCKILLEKKINGFRMRLA